MITRSIFIILHFTNHPKYGIINIAHGGCGEVVNTSDCGSDIRGFDSPQSPHLLNKPLFKGFFYAFISFLPFHCHKFFKFRLFWLNLVHFYNQSTVQSTQSQYSLICSIRHLNPIQRATIDKILTHFMFPNREVFFYLVARYNYNSIPCELCHLEGKKAW